MSVARGEPPELDPLVRAAPDGLVDALRHHRLAPAAHVLLRTGAPEVAALLAEDRYGAMATHLHVTTLLHHLDTLLDGVPWAVVKGPVLSELAHPVPGLRPYRDVDVLVAPANLRTVCERLLTAGWTVASLEDMLRFPELPGQLHWRSPTGIQMDLHWNLVNEARRRRARPVPSAELLARRVPVTLGFFSGWTLEPVDALVHVCLHAALSGANKLVYLVDAQRMAARVGDAREVASRATDWGATPHVALVLRRARAALGGPLPGELDRLTSPAFRALTTAVDRVAPVPRAREDPGLARLVARAVRPGAARTTLAAARSTGRYLFGRPSPVAADRALGSRESLESFLLRVEAEAAAGTG